MAIGFAVFLAHMVLIPIDGCSINPARSFGPAVISYLRDCPNKTADGLKDMWVMVVGPFAGGAFATLLAIPMCANPWLIEDPDVDSSTQKVKVNAELENEQQQQPPAESADSAVQLPLEANRDVDVEVNRRD
jgi:hypothetical protein